MKQMVEANESLMKLHKDAKDITEVGDTGEPNDGGTTNNYFAGSTEDLLNLVEQMENKGTPIIIDNE